MDPLHGTQRGRAGLLLAAMLGLILLSLPVRAHDIPNEILLHGFVKPEGERLHFVVRVPLIMLASMSLPKRGPGYLDLARLDHALETSATATARQIQLYEDGVRLTPSRVKARISQPSDRSFETFETARVRIAGPKLPAGTNVFWNQGFFDAHLEYPIRSDQSDFALDMRVAPGLSGRLKMIVRYIPPAGSIRAYEIHAGFGRLALDPRWHQAAGVFVKSGFFHILDGTDHLLFLFCLVIPFRRRWWDLLKIITAFTVAHTITLIAAAQGLVPAGDWFPPLVETLIAASIVYMALENIVAADLRRRWLITAAFGLVHGFGFSFALQQDLQFAGDHLLLSLVSFNVGVELGQILVLLLVLPVLGLLFRRRSVERFGVVILSVFLAHTGWHWMLDRVQGLRNVEWPSLDAASLAGWGLLLLLVGGAAWAIVKQWNRRLAAQRRAGDDLT
ncbi:MAG: HupE/UreJ family protein [Gammaproteobacteria bacterium]|nr:HupE/UreJ family protein [Gammaproteobacteria bacterium]